jgi:hypothetical protein
MLPILAGALKNGDLAADAAPARCWCRTGGWTPLKRRILALLASRGDWDFLIVDRAASFLFRVTLRRLDLFEEEAHFLPHRRKGLEYAAAARCCQTRSIAAVLFNLPG